MEHPAAIVKKGETHGQMLGILPAQPSDARIAAVVDCERPWWGNHGSTVMRNKSIMIDDARFPHLQRADAQSTRALVSEFGDSSCGACPDSSGRSALRWTGRWAYSSPGTSQSYASTQSARASLQPTMRDSPRKRATNHPKTVLHYPRCR
jgi:hypothetical protein